MTNTEQLAKAEERLIIWEAAEERIAVSGKSYSFNDGDLTRQVSRADLKEVHQMVIYLTNKIEKLERVISTGKSGNILHARGV